MNITIERTPRTLQAGNETIQVEALNTQLDFVRKPANLTEMTGGSRHQVYITETKVLTAEEFDLFARSLLTSRDWLRGKGGGTDDGFFCVEVTAPGRPCLYVNPEGDDYARYVARLG